jgi:cysteinyl-tRNA synthetase
VSELHFYNQLHRRKEPFRPIEPGRVRIYSCGPTVYARQHVGNMRPYVFADVLRRTLELFGHPVQHVVNITDVGHLAGEADDSGDDKMEARARSLGESVWEIAARFTELWHTDLQRLAVKKAEVFCKATDHIAEQIEMIRTLEARGLSYLIRDGVYFDTSKFPSYGELVGGDRDAQQAQERIEAAGEKRNPCDFALWKLSPPDGPRRQMEWDSPWGRGFPGWHIECSAMSAKYLGVPFDIHTGGADHIPVHHTNEIAQSESAFGVRPCVNFWMHNGWLMIEGEKISKSSGHTLNLDDLIAQGMDPLAFRLFLLGGHYRQQMNFQWEAMKSSQKSLERLRRHALEPCAPDETVSEQIEPFRQRFRAALADDLNTPQALAVLWEAVRSDALGPAARHALLREFDAVLALGLDEVSARAALERPLQGDDPAAAQIEALIAERKAARANRDFARSDAIRDELKGRGILLEDGPDGTRWRRA